jgi:hypothetical protein
MSQIQCDPTLISYLVEGAGNTAGIITGMALMLWFTLALMRIIVPVLSARPVAKPE